MILVFGVTLRNFGYQEPTEQWRMCCLVTGGKGRGFGVLLPLSPSSLSLAGLSMICGMACFLTWSVLDVVLDVSAKRCAVVVVVVGRR